MKYLITLSLLMTTANAFATNSDFERGYLSGFNAGKIVPTEAWYCSAVGSTYCGTSGAAGRSRADALLNFASKLSGEGDCERNWSAEINARRAECKKI